MAPAMAITSACPLTNDTGHKERARLPCVVMLDSRARCALRAATPQSPLGKSGTEADCDQRHCSKQKPRYLWTARVRVQMPLATYIRRTKVDVGLDFAIVVIGVFLFRTPALIDGK